MLSVVQVCVVLPVQKHRKYKSQLALESLTVKHYCKDFVKLFQAKMMMIAREISLGGFQIILWGPIS